MSIRSILLGGLLLPLALVSCVDKQVRWAEMSASDKAREIKRRRDSANNAMIEYMKDKKLESLLSIVEDSKVTTEIAPDTCPSCFWHYGYALSMLGRHHFYLRQDALAEAEASPRASDEARLRAEADEHDAQMRDAFLKSYKNVNFFFNHPNRNVPVSTEFLRVMEDLAVYQENYEAALVYLRYYEISIRGREAAEEEKEFIRNTRQEFERKLQNRRGRRATSRPERTPAPTFSERR